MKFSTLLFLLLFAGEALWSQNKNLEILGELDELLAQKPHFLQLKSKRIDSIRGVLRSHTHSANYKEQFRHALMLSQEYQSFQYDSAFNYIVEAKQLAQRAGNGPMYQIARIKEGFVLLSSGLFKEAIDSLQTLSDQTMPDSIRREYCATIARSYFDLADYNKDPYFTELYKKRGVEYLDKAQKFVLPNTSDYWSMEALRRMKQGNYEGSKEAFTYWMKNFELTQPQIGIAASSLGYLYNLIGDKEKAIYYLTLASIADVRAATLETVALRNLSYLLFQEGDHKTAYRYILLSLEDAGHFNARHRKIEIATILPIIEGERLAVVEAQKMKLIGYSASMTLLAFVIILSLTIIYKQLQKIKRVRQILQETNHHLNQINKNLNEANTIKEEYIGYFFHINSEMIARLDTLQKNLHRKVMSKQFEELGITIRSIDPKKEREALYANFDKIFLKLFPSFVAEFNQLYRAEDQHHPKEEEPFTPEMRIYALIRIGIKDNERIARFLHYSVTTIYTYKTKAKARSLFREQFEEKIMEISGVKQ